MCRVAFREVGTYAWVEEEEAGEVDDGELVGACDSAWCRLEVG